MSHTAPRTRLFASKLGTLVLRFAGLVTALLLSSAAGAQAPASLQATLFYQDSSATFRSFNQPLVDKNGNVIDIATQFGFECGFNECGVVLYSIAPNGVLNWKKPDTGFAAPGVNRVALGADNTIYFQGFAGLGEVFAYDAAGNPVPNWPVDLGFPLQTQPGALLVDPVDNSVVVKGQTGLSGTFTGRTAAYHPDASEKWHHDFLNTINTLNGMVLGPNDDVYTFSDRAVILSHADGHEICSFDPQFFPPVLVGGSTGVFTYSGGQILQLNPDCTVSTFFTSDQGGVEALSYDNGVVFGIDFPPSDGTQSRMIGVRQDGTFWRNPDFIPTATPLIKNGFLYAIGTDAVDRKQKLFLADENAGTTVAELDLTGLCTQCGIAAADDGTIYISFDATIFSAKGPASPVSTQPGILNITTNQPGATFTISGPTALTGSGIFSSLSLTPGTYTITFDPIPGSATVTPAPQSIRVSSNQTTSVTGTYLIPQPTVTNIYPNYGTRAQVIPIVKVTGENFLPTFNVSFSGGVTVRAAQFVSSTEIDVTLDIPRNADLGLQSITVDNGCLRECAGPAVTLSGEFDVRRRPVIVLPGVMGSTLEDNNGVAWLTRNEVTGGVLDCDKFLFSLALNNDGSTPSAFLERLCDFGLISGHGEPLHATGLLKDSGTFGFDFYGGIVNSLRSNGFAEIPLPYDWRLDYRIDAQQLRTLIEQLAPKPWDRVDLVAHSQGGLVARTYLGMVQTEPSRIRAENSDDSRIDTLIFLGTPHRGAPKSFAVLSKWQDYSKFLRSPLFPSKFLNFETMSQIAENFPAVYELLPQDFFVAVDSLSQPSSTTIQNSDLPNGLLVLNSADLWSNLLSQPLNVPRPIEINGSGQLTLTGFEFRSGVPCRNVTAETTGDGTVPKSSSSFFTNIPTLYVNEEHSALPNNQTVDSIIPKLLDGAAPASLASDPSFSSKLQTVPFGDNGHYFVIHTCSPVTMQIENSSGAMTGFDSDGNLVTEIPQSDFLKFPENEAALLAGNDQYQIKLQATDNGTFTLISDLRDSQNVLSHLSFADVPISNQSRAQVTIDPSTSAPILRVDIDGDGTFDFSVGANSPAAPRSYVQTLLVIIPQLGLSSDRTHSLLESMTGVEEEIDEGRPDQAKQRLMEFVDKVTSQTGSSISADQAALLTRLAELAVKNLGP